MLCWRTEAVPCRPAQRLRRCHCLARHCQQRRLPVCAGACISSISSKAAPTAARHLTWTPDVFVIKCSSLHCSCQHLLGGRRQLGPALLWAVPAVCCECPSMMPHHPLRPCSPSPNNGEAAATPRSGRPCTCFKPALTHGAKACGMRTQPNRCCCSRPFRQDQALCIV